jgi:hypothetical protein
MTKQWPTYLHRANPDGTFDSICIRCFTTIASAVTESGLAGPEVEHVCAPSTLSERDKPREKTN